MAVTVDKTVKAFNGSVYKLKHESECLGTPMTLSVFLPSSYSNSPVLFYLAGLTCTGDNGLEKGGFLAEAEKHKIAIVFPDTSPRSINPLPIETESWDLGTGAGFYINATNDPWKQHYQMETYITKELPELLMHTDLFKDLNWSCKSLFGHSMGGHGALTLFLKYPQMYTSVSAFAPICNPTECLWGKKAFTNYLGSVEAGKPHDATELVKKLGSNAPNAVAKIDVGSADGFLHDGQLLPQNLVAAAESTPFKIELNYREGYDHSYFFVSTFAAEHIQFHAEALNK